MTHPTVSFTGSPILFFREFEEPYGFLSQWYASSFTAPAPPSAGKNAPDMTFLTTEQYMMYHKAILFEDQEIARCIMLELGPKKQKALGRKVKGFDSKIWDREKEKIVENGNWWKFTQPKEKDLRPMLLETGQRELVEVGFLHKVNAIMALNTFKASPFDRIWGVGYSAANAESSRANWGENLLGKALTRVRERLRAEESSMPESNFESRS